ncbi:MAG TPA: aldo/keto reductase [Steroidobacteraceae bacterium]|jgi:aryl-alcohol dehydrogenase-like predicted oxidoreductase
MQQRRLGSHGPEVSALGLGCMSLGIARRYSSSIGSEREAVELIHRALDLGITLLDTANIYGDSELKVGQALRGRRAQAILATKFGIVTERRNASDRGVDGRPANVRACCEASLKRLGVEQIDLHYQHRVDPQVPIEETVGAMAALVQAGKVRQLGLSEAAPATIRRAHRVHPIAALQTEYSLWSREPEAQILPTLRELGIALVAYSPLGRGFLAGRFRKLDELASDDWRRSAPRFQGDNFDRNLALLDRLQALAAHKGCTPAQLALAWLLARGSDIVPIPGTSSLGRLQENVAAAAIVLSDTELAALESAAPVGVAAGERYAAAGMADLNH